MHCKWYTLHHTSPPNESARTNQSTNQRINKSPNHRIDPDPSPQTRMDESIPPNESYPTYSSLLIFFLMVLKFVLRSRRSCLFWVEVLRPLLSIKICTDQASDVSESGYPDAYMVFRVFLVRCGVAGKKRG